MAVHWDLIFNNLSDRIDDLEKEISERLPEMCAVEAKVSYNNLVLVYKEMIAYESQAKTIANTDRYHLIKQLSANRKMHLRVFKLKLKLAKIFSPDESTLPTETEMNLDNIQFINPTKQPETEKNLDSQIQKQSFLVRRIESLELHQDICSTKAEVLNNHISQLYDSFISNQLQIEANLDDDATLDNQQKIATEIQRKVIDFQTKLRKIMQPIASTSSTESIMNNQPLHQSTKTDSKNTTASLAKIETLHPEQTDLQATNLKLKLANLEKLSTSLLGCLSWVGQVFEEYPTIQRQELMAADIRREELHYKAELKKIMQP
ncbi:uncharacterized protein LOC135844214 [Planococcus citri]|uniref:uncharacterized protein LOC135844214 n=1 Tax=Planococcus citri TaxID=170843 RepID=UPI0031F87383